MRIFFGVVFALLAFFCGGCSLYFLAFNFGTGMSGLILAVGGIPAAVFGLIAWLLLRKSDQDAPR